MKILIWCLVSLSFCSFAYSESSSCTTSSLSLELNLDVDPQCRLHNFEGNYQLKLCTNDQGLLLDEDSNMRFLFKADQLWMARQDLLDFTNRISNTEIMHLDFLNLKFMIQKIKVKQNGYVLSQFECNGTLKFSN